MRHSAILIAVFTVLSIQGADAKRLTLACTFKTAIGTREVSPTHPYRRVDQIVIDTDNSSWELRVANAVGTPHEEIYSYKEVDHEYCLKPQLQTPGMGITGSQQCNTPISFTYYELLHEFTLSWLSVGGGTFFIWECN